MANLLTLYLDWTSFLLTDYKLQNAGKSYNEEK